MATVAHRTRPRKSTHSAHRLAFGPGRKRTAQQKAADVARSIALRNDERRDWDWSTYGLEAREEQQALVVAELLKLALDAKHEAQVQAHAWEQAYAQLEALEALEELEVTGRR